MDGVGKIYSRKIWKAGEGTGTMALGENDFQICRQRCIVGRYHFAIVLFRNYDEIQ
jgi:hypothetical protein